MKYTTIDTRDEVTVTPAQPPAASVVLLHGLGADGWDFVPIGMGTDARLGSYVTLTGNIVAHLRDD
jgi:predicted esterase